MNETTLHELIEASPFEQHKNMGGQLTEDLFFSDFLVGKDHLQAQKDKLLYYIDPNKSDRSIIFLYGFSGNGKTTFLHWFISTSLQTFEHIYLSVDRTDTSLARISSSADPKLGIITETVNRKVKRLLDTTEFPKLISFLSSYPLFVESDEYFSNNFRTVLSTCFSLSKSGELTNEFRLRLFEKMKFKDAFILMFIFLLKKRLNSNKRIIIYFDNLDLAEIEFMTKEFEAIFFGLIDVVKQICDDPSFPFHGVINFSRDFKLVFCLRDINYALLNVHLREISRSSTAELKFDGFAISHDIFERRLSLVKKYCDQAYETEAVDSMTMMNKDEYVRTLLGPLYNFDYRKVSSTIYDFHFPRTSSEQPFNVVLYRSLYKFEKSLSRGLLIYRLLRYLNDRYLKYFIDESSTPVGGRCSPHRMVLQYIINRSDYSVEFGHKIRSEVSVYDVIKSFEKIYDKSELLRLLRLYYYTGQRSNWSHLISFSGSTSNFDSFLRKVPTSSNIDSQLTKKIYLSITPSGFIHCRYLITHFEYYLFLTKAKKPLTEMTAFSDETSLFEFELYIDAALRKVKLHIDWMSHFYKNRFNRLSLKEFKRSDYSWKHFKSRTPDNSTYGQFHSERIITSHISYLDHFRIFCIKGNSNIAPNRLLDCNAKLVEYIASYYNLFASCIDGSEMIDGYVEFKRAIEKIRLSKYSDFDTLIKKNPS